MAEKTIKSRIQVKRGSSTDWKTAGSRGFIPKEGEIIFYSDLNKIKIGDGKTIVDSEVAGVAVLPFMHVDKAEIDHWDHTHTTTIAASNGANELTLAHGTKYAINAGGDSFVFTMPADSNTHNSHKINSGKKSDNSTDIISAAASSGDITLGDSGVTAGTYRSVTVNSKGIVVAGSSTDADTNTWRKVQLNGTDKLGTGTNTNPLNIKAGSNMTITESNGTFTFSATDTNTDTHYTKYLQIKGNGTEAIKYTQDSDKSLNLKPGTNVSISAASGEITISATDTNTTYDLSAAKSKSNGSVTLDLTASGSGSGTDSVTIKGTGATTVTTDANGVITINSTDNNTDTNTSHSHSAGVGLVGSGSAGTSGGTYDYKAKLRSETALTVDSAAATTTAGRVYPVAVDKSGYLSVNVPWTDTDTNTDTKVTAVGNHYTPSPDTSAELTASLSGTAGAYAKDTEYTVLTGVKAQRDAKGHVTGITYTAQKIKDTNTTYTIPTVNNAKLTLNVGNQTVSGNDAFTANDATDTTYNVPSATASNYGVVKVSSVNTSAVTVNSESTTAGRYYPVELNSDGKAIVNVPWTDTNTDTHYTTGLFVGATNTKSNAATANGSTYLKLYDNDTKRAEFKISGSGATTVTSDANGNIVISSTDTNTDNDTKNTAGSTNSSKKLYLIGAEAQDACPQTYSHDTAYVGTDGCLYSASTKVSVEGHTHKISGTVTKEIGGISKDKVYTDADIASVLSDLLFPYVAPSFSSISTSDASGTFEYGTTKTISKVTPNFTKGSKNITSVKIGTTSGGADLYSGTTATSGTAITLTTKKTFDGSTGGTIYCTISDGTTPVTKSASVSYTYYDYSKLTTSTSPDTSGATKQTSSGADNTYSYTAGQYLWLYSRSSGKKIQTYVAGSWADVTTTASAAITLTLSSGAKATYYAYRTDKFTATGQARYRLA